MAQDRPISWQQPLVPQDAVKEERSQMRAVANNLILHLHPTRVPAASLRFAYTWGLGGISALLAVLLAGTGLLLMFRYEPTVERAYLSIQILESRVVFGSLIRGIHHWSAQLLVITAFLHLLRVLFTGGYKKGRTVNWIVGVVLLLLVLAFNFTGYLLPWDQLSYWAVTVVSSLINYLPLVGDAAASFLLGGQMVGQGTLRNFYAIHVAVLPALMVAMMVYHFWKIRKNGGISYPEPADDQPVERVTTLPNLVQIELAALAVVLFGIVIWAMVNPAPLAELADPTQSPNPAKAAWYFLGIQELLLHMHPLAAVGLVAAVLVILFILPYLDREGKDIGVYFRSPVGKRAALFGALLGLDLMPVLVVLDEYWLDWAGWLPGLPVAVTTGLLPLGASLLALAGAYWLMRRWLKANNSEAWLGLFTFIWASMIVLTIVGNFFRGANMALVLPF